MLSDHATIDGQYDPNDPHYIKCLDHGHVYLVDHMGSDAAIVQAARVSYGLGTKNAREDRGLIRYLMRQHHTSPFEMCEVKLHLKLPIFVFRQWVRHRTASVNEYSGRYSVMTDEFYQPDAAAITPQSTTNRQGRSNAVIDDVSKAGVQWLITAACETNHEIYRTLLGPDDGTGPDEPSPYDPYAEGIGITPILTPDFPGVARELARIVLPLSTYTEVYWKQNLHNLFHLIKLRTDAHAQAEIQVYAEAVYRLIQPLFPLACEAFEDYVNGATNLSRMEMDVLLELLHPGRVFSYSAAGQLAALITQAGSAKAFAATRGMSERELRDFTQRFRLDTNRAA